ncbi:MAG: HU family DNA-binding protein [Acidimicrobiia bacterium]
MNKSELVSAIAGRTGQSDRDVSSMLDAFQSEVIAAVAKGEKVQIPGFLSFESSERAARTGRNPSTGEEIQIAAATVPKVKVGKAFKDAVAK